MEPHAQGQPFLPTLPPRQRAAPAGQLPPPTPDMRAVVSVPPIPDAFPTRPTWNPVDAEAAAAPAPSPAPATAPVVESLPQHHTVTPRVLCVCGYFASLPVAVLYAGERERGDDVHSQRVLVAVLLVCSAAYGLGWLWWTVAAALNARKTTLMGVSALTAPVYALLAVVGIRYAVQHPDAAGWVMMGILLGYLWVLNGFRTTAKLLVAPSEHFARLMWLPLVVGVSSSAAALLRYGSPVWGGVAVLTLYSLGVTYYGITINRAMSSFDRAAARKAERRDDAALVPAIFRGSGDGA